jgi:hypothetical protein
MVRLEINAIVTKKSICGNPRWLCESLWQRDSDSVMILSYLKFTFKFARKIYRDLSNFCEASQRNVRSNRSGKSVCASPHVSAVNLKANKKYLSAVLGSTE